MNTVADQLWAAIAAQGPWEALAVALAVAYLVLAIRENVWCWAAGIASTVIYLALFFRARLYTESVLQLFYIGVSVYGWRQWSRPARELPVTTWTLASHAMALGGVALLATATGAVLAAFTPAAFPYLDAFISWSSVITTWMVARKVLENWLYWFVIDGVSIYVYVSRGLWLTAGLFVAYLVLIVIGYATWRRHLRESRP